LLHIVLLGFLLSTQIFLIFHMGGIISKGLRIAFATGLAVNMLWSSALMKVISCLPAPKLTRQGICLMVIQAAWKLSLMLSPWMWYANTAGYSDEWSLVLKNIAESDASAARGDAPYRPLFILGNHTSFFDTVLSATCFPSRVLWRCRTYMDKGLFKLPILSTVCTSIGHFPVYFQSAEEGKFKVDKEKMDVVEQNVDEHIKQGGFLCFFPEGQTNKTLDNILPFRYGGMKKALDFDARMILFVAAGNTSVWPKKALIGGFPGRIAIGAKALAPKGAKALVAELRAKCTPEEKDMADQELLAKYARDAMQQEYDKVKMSLPSSVLSLLWSSSFFLVFYSVVGISMYHTALRLLSR